VTATNGQGAKTTARLARKIHDAFSSIITEAERNPQAASVPVRDAWRAALGTTDDRSLWRAFDTLLEAIDRFEAGIEQLDDQGSETRKMLADLVAGMRQWLDSKNLGSSCSNFIQRTPRAHLSFLLFVESALEKGCAESRLAAEGMKAIVEKMQELESLLTDETIPARLRAMLHSLVSRMKWAVAHYDLLGVDGLVREVAAAQVTLIHLARIEGIDPAKQPSWFAKAAGTIKSINAACRTALSTYKTGKEAIETAKEVAGLLGLVMK
jgi:hypothetical protein